jgi:hypothetical protein
VAFLSWAEWIYHRRPIHREEVAKAKGIYIAPRKDLGQEVEICLIGGRKLDEQKYAWRDPGIPIEKKLDLAQKGLWQMIARIVRVVKDKYGEDGLEAIRDAFRYSDVHRASAERAGIKSGTGSIRDYIFKMMDVQDSIFLITGKRVITEEPDENRVHVVVPKCNVAGLIARECPETCDVIAIASAIGWADAVNPNIKYTQDKCLAAGDDSCSIYLEMVKPSSGT